MGENDFELITEAPALEALIRRLRDTPRVAIDTESASFHRYADRVYLVQLSTPGDTALIDPLAVPNLAPLGQLLADPAVEVVFHDADYDLRVLDRDYGFRARRIFDTRVAAQFAGEAAVGLGSLLEAHFRVRLDKKYQRADWSRRPLSAEMLEYAAADTRYLLPLRDLLESRLEQMGRLQWAQEEFLRLEGLRWTQPREADPDAYLRLKGARTVPRQRLGVLRELFAWREAASREADRPPFRILANDALIALARRVPDTPAQLAEVRSVPRKVAARFGPELLGAIARGVAIPSDALPRIPRTRRPPPDPGYEARLERLKALRDACASREMLDPGILCPNGTLQAVARAEPTASDALEQIPELRTWQRKVLQDAALLAAVRAT